MACGHSGPAARGTTPLRAAELHVRPQVTQPMHSRALRPHCQSACSVQRCQIASLRTRGDCHDERLRISTERALRSAPPEAAPSNTSVHKQDENCAWLSWRISVGHALRYECKEPAEVGSALVKLRQAAKLKCSFALVASSAQSGQHSGESSFPRPQNHGRTEVAA